MSASGSDAGHIYCHLGAYYYSSTKSIGENDVWKADEGAAKGPSIPECASVIYE